MNGSSANNGSPNEDCLMKTADVLVTDGTCSDTGSKK